MSEDQGTRATRNDEDQDEVEGHVVRADAAIELGDEADSDDEVEAHHHRSV